MDPDEECQLCGNNRDSHGDANHEFSKDGSLVPKKKPEPARQQPPKERGESPQPTKGVEEMEKSHLRLLEVLVSKGILDAKDLLLVLGGHAPS